MKRLLVLSIFSVLTIACQIKNEHKEPPLTIGAALFQNYLPLLKNKNIALIVNQTSMVGNTHLVDTLLSKGINIVKIFAPEHGFRGSADAGEHVEDGVDVKTNIPIVSLYGDHKKPTEDDLATIDIVIFDIQDVGVRFYTYISTMHLAMEACAEQNKKFIVLDRPNPNGHYIAGPILDMNYKSFVGMHPIPIVHGLTIGEFALMINEEEWLTDKAHCDLNVVKMMGYTHNTRYELPVKPSPNLPNKRSIDLYPSLCLLEPTVMSIGRGTPFPFQVVGYPDSTYGNFSFKPVSIIGASKYPKHENESCYGEDLREMPTNTKFSISWLIKYYQEYSDSSFFTSKSFFDKLAGNSILREQLQHGLSQMEIEESWEIELEKYALLRKKHLLYPDFN